jgi:tRNA threonylcarbamoyladenosine biosynthesis protein TsaB
VPATVLAVDTATDICSVALASGDRIAERAEAVGQRHSERVLPMVHALLHEHRLNLTDCEAIAFGAGPGAFTGLRIACGIAQGLAFGAGKPVVAIGNLHALALAAIRAVPNVRRVLTAIDARMREIYWAVYAIDAGLPTEISAPALAPADDLPRLCARHAPDIVTGSAVRAFADISASLACATKAEPVASAAAIATLARVALAAGRAVPAEMAAPIYVRDRVALTIEERRTAVPAAAPRRAARRPDESSLPTADRRKAKG